jgi:hypothetical protein
MASASDKDADYDAVFKRNRGLFPWSDSEHSEDEASAAMAISAVTTLSTDATATATNEPEIPTLANDAVMTPANEPQEPQEPDAEIESVDGCSDLLADGFNVNVISETQLAYKILGHCKQQVHQMRLRCGGIDLCVFKIGITARPHERRNCYEQRNYSFFKIIHIAEMPENLVQIELLEAALIDVYSDGERKCRNKRGGGESMRTKLWTPRFPPPYFCYVAASPANQRKSIIG